MWRFRNWKDRIEKTRKLPKWQWFDLWVLGGAIVGLGVAFGVFCLVQFVLFRNGAVLLNIYRVRGDTKPSDIITMTATALGGLTIGAVAVMQYRKHKWEEYQTKLDGDTKTGERLGRAIEHLSSDQLHTRLGAIYEFKNLAEDSPRNKENIVQILTAFIKSWRDRNMTKTLPQDIEAAARMLSQLTRGLIEETAKEAKANNFLRPKRKKFVTEPSQCVFDATEELSYLVARKAFQLTWFSLRAEGLALFRIRLNGASLRCATFKDSMLIGANMEGAELEFSNLNNGNFDGANLKGAALSFAHLEGTSFFRAQFDEKTDFGEGEGKAIIDDKTLFDPGVREKYFDYDET